jgi:hypothetical protein
MELNLANVTIWGLASKPAHPVLGVAHLDRWLQMSSEQVWHFHVEFSSTKLVQLTLTNARLAADGWLREP